MHITLPALTKADMEQRIRDYFAACNSADAGRIAAFFTPDAVHYFPGELYGGPCRGSERIGQKCSEMVRRFGTFWTIDQLVCDPDTGRAATEWTLDNQKIGVLIRGAEWYHFDADGLLVEVRAFVAMAPDRTRARYELGGFDYAGRGYALGTVQQATEENA